MTNDNYLVGMWHDKSEDMWCVFLFFTVSDGGRALWLIVLQKKLMIFTHSSSLGNYHD